MDDHYPETPGSVADSATSGIAGSAAKDFSASLADRCEQWFKHWGEKGGMKTCEECEDAAEQAFGHRVKHQTISARIRTDLYINRQCLYKMGTDRTTRQSVKVWYTTDITNLIRNAKGQIVFWTRANKSGRPAVLYGWGYEK